MNCYISMRSPNTAKRHIDELMARMGFTDLVAGPGGGSKVATFTRKLLSVCALPFRLHRGDVLVIQYPFKKFYVAQCRIAQMRGAKTVTLIHDLGTFRRRKLTADQEIRRLSHTHAIISHNPSMTRWLVEHGCKVPLTDLDIFDYLAPSPPDRENAECAGAPTVVFAGGISRRKTSFLYHLDPVLDGLRLDLYGSGLEEGADKDWRNIHFHGQINSDEFIRTGGGQNPPSHRPVWGLVWDGDTIDECSGVWGSYLRVNNPHKTSFYLRAGLPVIVWSESAMAPFITTHHLGVAVDSLRELPQALAAITPADYQTYKQAALDMAAKLQAGQHFADAFQRAVGTL